MTTRAARPRWNPASRCDSAPGLSTPVTRAALAFGLPHPILNLPLAIGECGRYYPATKFGATVETDVTHRKTTATARQIGVPPAVLLGWVRHGILATPLRDDSGHYLWDEAAIAAACRLRDERRARSDRRDPRATE